MLDAETILQNMEKLGWVFVPTGPDEGEYCKFVNGQIVASQGDATWAEDCDNARRQSESQGQPQH